MTTGTETRTPDTGSPRSETSNPSTVCEPTVHNRIQTEILVSVKGSQIYDVPDGPFRTGFTDIPRERVDPVQDRSLSGLSSSTSKLNIRVSGSRVRSVVKTPTLLARRDLMKAPSRLTGSALVPSLVPEISVLVACGPFVTDTGVSKPAETDTPLL